MSLIDELKQQRAEYDERYQRSMMDHAYFVGRLNDLDTAIAALESPSQPLPGVEMRPTPPAVEEEERGTISLFRDEFTGHSVDEEGQDLAALRHRDRDGVVERLPDARGVPPAPPQLAITTSSLNHL